MRFDVALTWMKKGKAVRVPGFIGYWYWDNEQDTIIMVMKNNERLDIRQTNDLSFTLGFINSTEWEIYNGEVDPRDNPPIK